MVRRRWNRGIPPILFAQDRDNRVEPPAGVLRFPKQARRKWLRQAPVDPRAPSPQDGRGHTTGRRAMADDNRPKQLVSPESSIDEVRALRHHAMVEAERERARYYELLREVRGLLKRVDEILARR
jgi:hypothetical protein